jgi:hypothetical protein
MADRKSQYSLFDGDVFTGQIAPGEVAKLRAREVAITGSAGSVCLMHTRLAHGSEPNGSSRPRGLYICVYTAADAFPLSPNPMANPNRGRIVRGYPEPDRPAHGGPRRAAGAAEVGLVLHGAGSAVGRGIVMELRRFLEGL